MSLIKSFRKAFLRKRHSRGFGVHSPFAFRFVEDVVKNNPYGFYAFDHIEDNPSLKPRLASEAKKLVRIAAFLGSRRFLVMQENKAAGIAAKAMRIPVIDITVSDFYFQKGDFMILDFCNTERSRKYKNQTLSAELTRETVRKAISKKINVLALNPDKELKSLMTHPLSRGLLLEAKKKLLLIPREEMAYVAYDINF